MSVYYLLSLINMDIGKNKRRFFGYDLSRLKKVTTSASKIDNTIKNTDSLPKFMTFLKN